MADDKEAMSSMDKICNAADIPNNFVLLPCTGIGNCFALYKNGISYIVYDITFFNRVKTFGFTQKSLPGGGVDWSALTILSHEVGHHLCQHTTNSLLSSRFTPVQIELQADEFAGSMMFKLGATLLQAQKAMYSEDITDEASLTHPARKDRLAAIAKGYNKYANKANPAVAGTGTATATIPETSNSKVTIVIPQFQVIARNVQDNLAEQLKQVLVNSLQDEGTYNIVASSFDVQNYKSDPAVAYGGDEAIKRANYVLLGKITQFEQKSNSFGLGNYNINAGTTLHYAFAFEMINAKTNEIVATKTCDVKVKSGSVGVSANRQSIGQVNLDANIQGEYEKKINDVIKYFTSQKSKIYLN